jgi:hypothetical protein
VTSVALFSGATNTPEVTGDVPLEIAGLAECEVGAQAGHQVVTCTPVFRLALRWATFTDMWTTAGSWRRPTEVARMP